MEDDVIPTLVELRKRFFPLVILTNNSRHLTDFALEKYKLLDLFDYVITRDDLKESKPDPEGLKKIAQKFNCNLSNLIFIGDSWVDAETAQNANITFVYYGHEGAEGTRRKRIPAKHTIETISELLNFV